MTQTDIRALAYQVYNAINAQDLDALEQLFAPDIIRHAMGQVGIEPAKTAVINAFKTNPEKRFVIEDAIVEGNKVAIRVTLINLPEGQPQPTILEIFRVENGRVAEIWGAGTMRAPGS